MSSIEKRLRDELGELASWLIDRRAESSSVEQADSGSDSIPRDSGADSIPRLDLDADTVRSGGRGRLVRVAAVLLLIVGLVGASGLLSEDAPSVVTVPADPASQTPTTSVPTTATVDDLSTDDAGDESSIVDLAPEVEFAPEADLAPEVELDVPPSEAFDESSIQPEEWLVGPFEEWREGEGWSDPQAAPWLFPWGNGFLQIGYLKTSEQIPSELSLYARTSDDGLSWEPPFQMNLPREHFEALETDNESFSIYTWGKSSWPIIRSNGKGLVVLSQLPGRHFAQFGADLALSRKSAPASAHVEQRAFVSVTDDLESWNHYEYPLLPPDGVHESLANRVVAEDVIVSDEGWMIQISTLTYVDIGLLVPANIREATEEIRWLVYGDDGYVSGGGGLHIEWRIENTNSDSTEPHRQFFSWEKLGTTYELFNNYGSIKGDAWHYSDRYSGSVLVARWGEEPIRAELPSVNGFCCQIIATDGGYIGLSDATEPGYHPSRFGWGALIFSPDGLTWQRIEPPAHDGFKELPEDLGMWIPSIHAVEDRIVMYGILWGPSMYGILWEANNECSDRPYFSYFWVGDAKGSNWESQNISDNPCLEWYRVANSAGRGVLVYSEVSENPDTIGDRYQSTIVSTDGVNWFTFYEEPDPNRSSVAFNGNVAVRVDNAGNSYRYELQ